MIWTQIKVKCNVTDLETVSAVMSMLDNFIMTEDYRDIDTELKSVYGDLIDESILKADKTKGSCSVFVPEEKNAAEYISYIDERLPMLGIAYETEIINTADEEWSTAWKKYYKPTPIGEKIVIVPSWEHYDKKDGEIIIDMDPGMAFGTGTHETTRLCASLLEKYIKSGDKMLDVGSGSGILAICGAKLGASSCFACDIDPVAVRTEKENFERNNCGNVTCAVSDLLAGVPDEKYDIVTANIVADIIIRLAPDVGRYMKNGAHIIVSGIISEREHEVDRAMTENGFTKVEVLYDGGWCAEVFRK